MKFKATLILFIFCRFLVAEAQNTQTEFGKNVLQFKDFEWVYYQTPIFDVYFYEGGREPARFVLEKGEKLLREVEKRLDYPLGEKVSFIVYKSFSEFRQSNYHLNEEVYNIGGRTPISGNKIFIYFNGDHADFERQIKAGFARLTVNELMTGGSIQQKVQSSVLVNVPSWCVEGIIRSLSEEWNPYLDNRLKDGIISEKFRKFQTLSEDETYLVGHSFWKFIYEQYGDAEFSNLIYNIRSEHGLEAGFVYVLGKSFSEVYNEWFEYHLKRFTQKKNSDPVSFVEIDPGKVFKKGVIARWDMNASGTKAGFVTNDNGKIKVWVDDLANHKLKCIYKTGYRRKGELNYNYPVICWSPVRDVMTVFFEHNSDPYYFNYDANSNTKEEAQLITGVDYVLDASYSQDGRFITAAAMKNGQSDIFIFDQRSQFFRPLTDDIYDDRQPRFVNNSKGIVFSSNRPDKILRKVSTNDDYHFNSNYDIYYFPDYLAKSHTVKRITNSKNNEWLPNFYDTSYLSYLTDANGILNRNAAHLDSVFRYIRVVAQYKDTTHFYDTFRFYKNDIRAVRISPSVLSDPGLLRIDTEFIFKDTVRTFFITDYSNNLLSYNVLPAEHAVYELFFYDGRYRLFKNPTPANAEFYFKPRSSAYIETRHLDTSSSRISRIGEPVKTEVDTLKKTSPVIKDTLAGGAKPYFQTEFPVSVEIPESGESDTGSNKAREAYKRQLLFGRHEKKKNKFAAEALYFLSFTSDLLVIQADNSINTTPYLPYKPGTPLIFNPTINGVFKLGVSDMFKDYRVIGGIGVRPDFSGADYFVTFENMRKRLDKRFIFYRKGQTQDNGNNTFSKLTSLEGRMELRWPFTETLSLRGSVFGRQDKTVFLTGDRPSLETPDVLKYWAGTKGELVFDNTMDRGLNIRTGSRYKVYSEFFDAVNLKSTLFAVVGADFRTYTKLSRQIIWANRIAYGSSFGTAKVVYFIGGPDGGLFPKSNNNPPDPNQNYVYMLQPGSVRGFDQNARNGNSFTLLNSEIRVPVFKYFLNRPLRSQMLDNFQVVPFFDAGSAWLGLLPTGENNAYATRYIYNNPLIVKVITNRDPFVYGYGIGLRTTLLGYFIRWDYAWGVENRELRGANSYFSLGLDF